MFGFVEVELQVMLMMSMVHQLMISVSLLGWSLMTAALLSGVVVALVGAKAGYSRVGKWYGGEKSYNKD